MSYRGNRGTCRFEGHYRDQPTSKRGRHKLAVLWGVQAGGLWRLQPNISSILFQPNRKFHCRESDVGDSGFSLQAHPGAERGESRTFKAPGGQVDEVMFENERNRIGHYCSLKARTTHRQVTRAIAKSSKHILAALPIWPGRWSLTSTSRTRL